MHTVCFVLLLFNTLSSSFCLILCRDLGVHVDGFIANVAHSFVVGASKVLAFFKYPELMFSH